MKKALLLFALLFVSVMTTACINKIAVEELNNKAAVYMNNGDTETAICRLKSSIDLDNEIYSTHYNLALAYIEIKNYEGAIQESDRVLELNPEFYEAYYTKAFAKYEIFSNNLSQFKDENGNLSDISNEQLSELITSANDIIDLFNNYVEKRMNVPEAISINEKISELNGYIKEFSYKIDDEGTPSNQATDEE